MLFCLFYGIIILQLNLGQFSLKEMLSHQQIQIECEECIVHLAPLPYALRILHCRHAPSVLPFLVPYTFYIADMHHGAKGEMTHDRWLSGSMTEAQHVGKTVQAASQVSDIWKDKISET